MYFFNDANTFDWGGVRACVWSGSEIEWCQTPRCDVKIPWSGNRLENVLPCMVGSTRPIFLACPSPVDRDNTTKSWAG